MQRGVVARRRFDRTRVGRDTYASAVLDVARLGSRRVDLKVGLIATPAHRLIERDRMGQIGRAPFGMHRRLRADEIQIATAAIFRLYPLRESGAGRGNAQLFGDEVGIVL